jgi:uncharacterized OB-fold protein
MHATPCARCGTALYSDDQFCVGCGHPADGSAVHSPDGQRITRLMVALKSGAHAAIKRCRTCGGAVFPEDSYCQSCGARIR